MPKVKALRDEGGLGKDQVEIDRGKWPLFEKSGAKTFMTLALRR
jgi:hypothetical protein